MKKKQPPMWNRSCIRKKWFKLESNSKGLNNLVDPKLLKRNSTVWSNRDSYQTQCMHTHNTTCSSIETDRNQKIEFEGKIQTVVQSSEEQKKKECIERGKTKAWIDRGKDKIEIRTFLRRPEVPGFCPSKGVVSTRETLKSTMAGWLATGTKKNEIRKVQIAEKN